MKALKIFLKRSLKILPIMVPYLIIDDAKLLHQYLGIPTWLIISAAVLTIIGYCVIEWRNGAEDRRKVAEDKRIYVEKVAAAEKYLFGAKQH